MGHLDTYELTMGCFALFAKPLILGGPVAGLAMLVAGLVEILSPWNFYENPIGEKIGYVVIFCVVGFLYLTIIISVFEKKWSLPGALICQIIIFIISVALLAVMIVRFVEYDYSWDAKENSNRIKIEQENNCCFVTDYDKNYDYFIFADCPYFEKMNYKMVQPCQEYRGYNTCVVIKNFEGKEKFPRCKPKVKRTDKAYLITLIVFYGVSTLLSAIYTLFLIAGVIMQALGWNIKPEEEPINEEEVVMANDTQNNNANETTNEPTDDNQQ